MTEKQGRTSETIRIFGFRIPWNACAMRSHAYGPRAHCVTQRQCRKTGDRRQCFGVDRSLSSFSKPVSNDHIRHGYFDVRVRVIVKMMMAYDDMNVHNARVSDSPKCIAWTWRQKQFPLAVWSLSSLHNYTNALVQQFSIVLLFHSFQWHVLSPYRAIVKPWCFSWWLMLFH